MDQRTPQDDSIKELNLTLHEVQEELRRLYGKVVEVEELQKAAGDKVDPKKTEDTKIILQSILEAIKGVGDKFKAQTEDLLVNKSRYSSVSATVGNCHDMEVKQRNKSSSLLIQPGKRFSIQNSQLNEADAYTNDISGASYHQGPNVEVLQLMIKQSHVRYGLKCDIKNSGTLHTQSPLSVSDSLIIMDNKQAPQLYQEQSRNKSKEHYISDLTAAQQSELKDKFIPLSTEAFEVKDVAEIETRTVPRCQFSTSDIKSYTKDEKVTSKQTDHLVFRNGHVENNEVSERLEKNGNDLTTICDEIGQILKRHAIPEAVVSVPKLLQYISESNMKNKMQIEEILPLLENKNKLCKLLNKLEYRVRARHRAAVAIQSIWKGYVTRKRIREREQQNLAATVITSFFISSMLYKRLREKIKYHQEQKFTNMNIKMKVLQSNWQKIMTTNHVIIHLPSLGYDKGIRYDVGHIAFSVIQSFQIFRLGMLRNNMSTVIYICPTKLAHEIRTCYEETLQYFLPNEHHSRFLLLEVEDVDMFETFPFSLSKLLHYSPYTMCRIRNLTAGRLTYVVPGIMNEDDAFVSDFLNIPFLAPSLKLQKDLRNKSQAMEFLMTCEIGIPYGAEHIYSDTQLFNKLTKLIVQYPDVPRWIIKLNSTIKSRGTMVFEVTTEVLPSLNDVMKEMYEHQGNWNCEVLSTSTYNHLLNELSQAVPNYVKSVSSMCWPTFVESMTAKGVIVQAWPAENTFTSITVSLLIEPNGNYHVHMTADQLNAESEFETWGYGLPQTSVDPDLVYEAASQIGSHCKQIGYSGYLLVDFISFCNSAMGKTELWAVDVDPCYGELSALSDWLLFVTGGTLNKMGSQVTVPVDSEAQSLDEEEREQHLKMLPPEIRMKVKNIQKHQGKSFQHQRVAVCCARLHHNSLANFKQRVFVKICKANHIVYNKQDKEGSIVLPIGGVTHEHFGMMTIHHDIVIAYRTFIENLQALNKEIVIPSMKLNTNFLKGLKAAKERLSRIENSRGAP